MSKYGVNKTIKTAHNILR